MQQLLIENLVIDIVRKKIKNTYLRIHGVTGRISVTAPLKLSERTLQEFIHSRIEWIKQYLDSKPLVADAKPVQFVSGETHYFQGKPYTLNVIIARTRGVVTIRDDSMDLYVPQNASIARRALILDRFYRARLLEIAAAFFIKWQPIMRVSMHEFNIKKMKTKWGTCNTRDKRIWLSLTLAKKSLDCIEYVVVHELVHLLEKSHNHVFKAYMDKFLPRWRAVKKELNA